MTRLGLGCATFGREVDETKAFGLMDYAIEHGITLFDTAEAYGGGQARQQRRERFRIDDIRETSGEFSSSEKIIGRWLRSRGARDKIQIVTKVSSGFQLEHVQMALEASLQRLQVSHVDLYLCHAYDPTTADYETSATFDAIIRSGLARRVGCSNYSGSQLQKALVQSQQLGHHGFTAIETPYNLLQQSEDIFPVAAAYRLKVIAYSPLAAGFLSGKYTFDRACIPKGSRFDVSPAHADLYFSERNFRRVRLLAKLAERIGQPATLLAIAWALQNPRVDTLLVGARSEEHIANAIRAERMIFQEDWLREINSWSDSPR